MANVDEERHREDGWMERLGFSEKAFWSPQKRRLRRAVFISAFVLAALGGVLYLVFQTSLWWWLAVVAVNPLVFLVVSRAGWLEDTHGPSDPPYGGTGDGPWGPP